MPRLLKGSRPFKPIKLVVAKDEPKEKTLGKITRGKYRKPSIKKKAKPTPDTAPDAGPFKGKF
jgi:hypothetical protein